VKLPADTIIAAEKLTRYLLVPQARGDKSGYLAKAGFTAANPEVLLRALRQLAASGEATPRENTAYGQFYEITARLIGPNQVALPVRTIWMSEHLSGVTKFITLVPDSRKNT
jgi:hypothetical protein